MQAVRLRLAILLLGAMLAQSAASQNCGWSRVDHRVNYDASGIWNTNVYHGMVYAATAAQIAGALWEGAESRFGKTMWQGIDSEIIAELTTTAGKHIFTRVRPIAEDNPCLWFQGGSNESFPSRDAARAAALVMPYILNMGGTYPATYALMLLPSTLVWDGSRIRRTGRPMWPPDGR
jgi:undecaprenyl-diphosphatase